MEMISEDTVDQKTADQIPPKPWATIPRWWIVLVLVVLSLALVASFFDQATSRLVLVLSIVLSILLLLLRNLMRPATSLAFRALPLLVFIGLLCGAGFAVRVDEMDGNLIPRRWSWRWEPAPDRLVAKLAPAKAASGVDLSVTAENDFAQYLGACLLYTSPSPRDRQKSRMPSSA